jgi:hypothetical protein
VSKNLQFVAFILLAVAVVIGDVEQRSLSSKVKSLEARVHALEAK